MACVCGVLGFVSRKFSVARWVCLVSLSALFRLLTRSPETASLHFCKYEKFNVCLGELSHDRAWQVHLCDRDETKLLSGFDRAQVDSKLCCYVHPPATTSRLSRSPLSRARKAKPSAVQGFLIRTSHDQASEKTAFQAAQNVTCNVHCLMIRRWPLLSHVIALKERGQLYAHSHNHSYGTA